MGDRLTELYTQLDEAKEKLVQVTQDIELAQDAVKGASSAEEAVAAAESVKHSAVTAISDVARMLKAEGPAAAIAEEMVDDDLNQVEEDTEALRSAGGSPRASAGPGSAAGSPRVGNAERTL